MIYYINILVNMRTEVMLKPMKEIIENYQIPILQRLVDNEHINSMVEDQKNEYNKYNAFSMLQSFTIAYIVEEQKGYILDGQHRVAAYSQLKKEGYDIDNILVPVVKYNVNSIDEVNEYFKRINIHSPIEPILNLETSEKNLLQFLTDRFTRKYFSYTDQDNTCLCPNISVSYLKKHIKAININNKLTLHNKTEKDLYNYILDVNNFLETISCYQLDKIYTNRFERCKNKKDKEGCKNACYLGVFRKCEWLDLAIYSLINSLNSNHYGTIIKSIISPEKREKITKNTKKEVWKKHNLANTMTGKCYVCENTLDYDNMECSHIIAHALGGDISLDNLQPCCKSCNRDMGIMNLYEYKNLIFSIK